MSKYPSVRVNGVKIAIHRLAMEINLGRKLKKNEHVYHLNGDPNDNRLENLVIVTKKLNLK